MAKQQEYGEGNYKAGREYQKDQHAFAKDEDRVKRKAKEAADALKGPERENLEKARRKTSMRSKS